MIRKILLIIIEQSMIQNLDLPPFCEKQLKKQKSIEIEEFSNEIKSKMSTIKRILVIKLSNLLEELEGLSESISEYSISHINSNEVIITFDYSTTMLNFLIEASKSRY